MRRVLGLLLTLACTSSAGAEMAGKTPAFDAAWTAYFSADCAVYAAVRDVNLDGPLMHRPLSAGDRVPSGEARAFLDEVKAAHVVDTDLSEALPAGFAFGLAPLAGHKDPAFLFVAPKSPKLVKLVDLVVAKHREKNGADAARDVTLEGARGVQLIKLPGDKVQPVLVFDDAMLVVAGNPEQAAAALKRARSGTDGFGSGRAYHRARPRVGEPAAFVLFDPVPFLDIAKAANEGKSDPTKLDDAKKFFDLLDAVVVSVGASKEASHVQILGIANATSAGYARLQKLAVASTVKTPNVVSAKIPALLALLRPADLSATMAAGQKESFAQQMQALRGMLQAQTGLDFDRDVAPWCGSELALAARVPAGGVLEVALFIESKDPKASQEALAKVVRHVGITQNRKFDEKKVEGGTLQVSTTALTPGIRPVLGSLGGYVLVATASGIAEEMAQSREKLADAPGMKRLAAASRAERNALLIWLRTDLVTQLSTQGGRPADPRVQKLAEEVDTLAVSLGWPDPETVALSVLFNGR